MRRLLPLLLLLLLPSELLAQSHPVFYQSAAEKAVRAQMKADYEADADCPTDATTLPDVDCTPATAGGQYYNTIRAEVVANNRYGDYGSRGAWMYRTCKEAGDPEAVCNAYRDQAYGKILPDPLQKAPGVKCGNNMTQGYVLHVVNYDQLYDGLTTQQRSDFMEALTNTTEVCLTGALTALADSDLSTGGYFGAAAFHCATESYNTRMNGYWNDSARKLGGYVATAENLTSTWRNAMKYYVNVFAEGGDWFESNHYNLGTMKIMLQGWSAIKSCRGQDDYPEIAAWLPTAAEAFMSDVTPGLDMLTSQPYQWGDESHPRDLITEYRWETASVMSGLLPDGDVRERIQDWVLDYYESAPGGFAGADSISPRFNMGLWNPYATRGDHTTGALYHWSPGPGVLTKRTSWTDGHFLGSFWDVKPHYQHYGSSFGGLAWWRGTGANGGWVITHPHSYGGPGIDSRGTNALQISGMPVQLSRGAVEYKKVRAEQDNLTHGFTYITGTQGGYPLGTGAYNGPEPHLMEHSRSLVFLPGVDSLVVYDRANSKDATTLPYFNTTGRPLAQRNYMQSRPRKVLTWHMPVSPTLGANYAEWIPTNAAVGTARVTMIKPTSPSIAIEYEPTVWPAGMYGDVSNSNWSPNERKYHIAVQPPTIQQWDTFLSVVQRHDGTPNTVTAVDDPSHSAEGVLITKGTVNRLLVFNAIQGPDLLGCTRAGSNCNWKTGNVATLDAVRMREAGYSVTFTVAGGSTTKALLFDLNPGTEWDYKINGGATQDMSLDADGVGVVDITPTGAVTLEVISSGVIPVAVVTGSLSVGQRTAAYSVQLTSSGGAGSPTWSVTAGTLHDGLTLTAGGLLSGTPTVAESRLITFQACDPDPNCATRQLTLDINEVPPLITTIDLPGGAVGTPYSAPLDVTLGTGPYVWSLASGTLCAGLSIASGGVISGTPTTAQTCNFTVRVTDAEALTSTQALSIVIAAPNLGNLIVKVEPGSDSAVIHYGVAAIKFSDSCTVVLKDAGVTPLASVTTMSGPPRRTLIFSGLNSNHPYSVEVDCTDAATEADVFFTTMSPVSDSRTFNMDLRASSTIWSEAALVDGTRNSLRVTVFLKVQPDDQVVEFTKRMDDAACSKTTHFCRVPLTDITTGPYESWYEWRVGAGESDWLLATTQNMPGYISVP